MLINGVKCLLCGDIIYSRARHDLIGCSCKNVYVDGGLDYFKVSAHNISMIDMVELEVDASRQQLYDDWNHMYDKYGRISNVG